MGALVEGATVTWYCVFGARLLTGVILSVLPCQSYLAWVAGWICTCTALGSTWWEMTWRVVLPAARAGIFGASVLALGRALGETIAVTMVIGNRPDIQPSLFAPGYTLASVVANEFAEAVGKVYLSALMEAALILFAITLIVNALAGLLVWSITRGTPRALA